MHNLADVLDGGYDGIPPTLRDSTLRDDVKALELRYLGKRETPVSFYRSSFTISYSITNNISCWTDANKLPEYQLSKFNLFVAQKIIQNFSSGLGPLWNLDSFIPSTCYAFVNICYTKKRLKQFLNSFRIFDCLIFN